MPWTGSHGDRYVGPFGATTAHPVLVANTLYDPATRYQSAVFVAGLLPNARLLTVHGWGHMTVLYSYLADMAVSAYLLDGTLPDPGTIYDQDYVPFQTSVAAPTSSASTGTRAQLIQVTVPRPVRKAVHLKEK